MPRLQARAFYSFQAFKQNIHAESYGLILQALVPDEEEQVCTAWSVPCDARHPRDAAQGALHLTHESCLPALQGALSCAMRVSLSCLPYVHPSPIFTPFSLFRCAQSALFRAMRASPVVQRKVQWAQKWVLGDNSFAERIVAAAALESIFNCSRWGWLGRESWGAGLVVRGPAGAGPFWGERFEELPGPPLTLPLVTLIPVSALRSFLSFFSLKERDLTPRLTHASATMHSLTTHPPAACLLQLSVLLLAQEARPAAGDDPRQRPHLQG